MKGFITKALLAGSACLAATAVGCVTYRDLVDPCYPQRYNYQARQETLAAFAPQVENGHILDQTVWNYHFEANTAKLTVGGQQHLNYLARRRPAPDPMVYVQTAQDVTYDPAAPEKLAASRNKLDSERVQAVERYLKAQTEGRGLTFQVAVHDPNEVGVPAAGQAAAIGKMYTSMTGSLGGGGGGGGGGSMGGK